MDKGKKLLLKDSIKAIIIVIAIFVGLAIVSAISDVQEAKNIVKAEFVNDPDSIIYKSEMHAKPAEKVVYVETMYGLLSIKDDNYYYKYNMSEGKKVNCKIEKLMYNNGSFKYKLVEIEG